MRPFNSGRRGHRGEQDLRNKRDRNGIENPGLLSNLNGGVGLFPGLRPNAGIGNIANGMMNGAAGVNAGLPGGPAWWQNAGVGNLTLMSPNGMGDRTQLLNNLINSIEDPARNPARPTPEQAAAADSALIKWVLETCGDHLEEATGSMKISGVPSMFPQFIVTKPSWCLHGAFKAYGPNTILMFHGTPLGNLRSILQNGFDNAVIWLADEPSESITDAIKGMGTARFVRDNERSLGVRMHSMLRVCARCAGR